MGLAAFVFWLGRWKLAHLPPAGLETVARTLRHEGRGARSHTVGPLSPLSPSHGLFRGYTRLE